MLHLQLSDREVERVLAGQQPYGRPDLAEVAYFVARLRALGDFERPPPMSPSLRGQLEAADAAQRRVADSRGHVRSQLTPAEARRRADSARWRWRLVGAAAVFVTLGGVVVAGWQGADGRSGSDTKTDLEPSDEPGTTAVQPDAGPSKEPVATPETAPAEPEAVDESPVTEPSGSPANRSDEAGTEGVVPSTPPPSASEDTGGGWFDWPDECQPQDWVCWWDHFDGDGPPGRNRDDSNPDHP